MFGTCEDDVIENPAGTNYIFGFSGDDTVRFNGSSDDWKYDATDDGGYVFWNEAEEFDILYDIEYVEFEDDTFELA